MNSHPIKLGIPALQILCAQSAIGRRNDLRYRGRSSLIDIKQIQEFVELIPGDLPMHEYPSIKTKYKSCLYQVKQNTDNSDHISHFFSNRKILLMKGLWPLQ